MIKRRKAPLWSGTDWTLDVLSDQWDTLHKIGKQFNWEGFPVQLEILDGEQLCARQTTLGLPIIYGHWSYGRDFLQSLTEYNNGILDSEGQRHSIGMYYEMIINSNPSICYVNEHNTNCMNLLILSHAAVGHNHFFKHNYLFKKWTQPDKIVKYLSFAKEYITECELKYGETEVASVLDAAQLLSNFGVFKYDHPRFSAEKIKAKLREKQKHYDKTFDTLIDSRQVEVDKSELDDLSFHRFKGCENILYFLEKVGNMPTWKTEIIRIVRYIAQYFYPLRQTKMMNEGFATFVHYEMMNHLYDIGYIDEGYMLEFFGSSGGVVSQPDSSGEKDGYGGRKFYPINPYYLGLEMYREIKRVCTNPTEIDKKECPQLAGKDYLEEVNYATANYRDESFILQYLTPSLMKRLRLFELSTRKDLDHYKISNVHSEPDYLAIRQSLSEMYRLESYLPQLTVVDFTERSAVFQIDSYKGNDVNIFTDKDVARSFYKALRTLASFDRVYIKTDKGLTRNLEDLI